ncbi:WD40 repeat domain-containing protein [Rufibacter sediminis]|uniref:Anaphase-promoting complex subunit 4 WD40 domain-containing protein n=1 Tax=Rufibacter sediminis TaxID=2762756 RepID=A0ABR6VV92_9BACT|nr:hypothetical protein [Rufibacter sediminis]MBC3541112.1 hypothetical protein [Rufibacter sediminis]
MSTRKSIFYALGFSLLSTVAVGQTKVKPLALLKHEENMMFQNAVFSPDGNRLVSVGNQGMLYLWDASQTFPVSFKQVHNGTALSCAYSEDGKYIVTGGEEKSLKILLARDLSLVKNITGLPARVREVSMTGNRLVALLQNNEIQIYNTDTWEKVGKPRYAAKDSKIVFSNQGDRFYVWFSTRINAISAKDGELLKVFNTNYATPTDLAISSDDQLLAVGYGQADEILRIYDTNDFKQVKAVKKSGAGDYASGLSFFHHSNKLLYQSNAGTPNLKIFDLDRNTNTSVSKGSASARTSISKDDSKVILAPRAVNSIQLLSIM